MATATMAHLTVLIALFFSTGTAAYTNHTVGASAGWLFNVDTNTSSANYSAWVANQTFDLGDYLIFNTNTNQTVILTYNETTYRSCSIVNSSDTDTSQYSGGNNQFGQPLTLAVPLTIEGSNYFFSDANDGVQCEQGMAFEINVKHGDGLPPSLNQPPPPPYVDPPSSGGANQLPPVTVVTNQHSGGAKLRWGLGVYVMLCGVGVYFV